MKWFKHHSDLSRNEYVAQMMDESGRDQLAVYGFFHIAMEHITEKIDPKRPNDFSVTYSTARWARIVGTNRQRVRALMEKLSTNRALSVEVADDTYTVTMPQLLDWVDDYFKKCGRTPDKVAQKRKEEKRREKREGKQKGSLSDCLKAGSQERCAPPDFEVTKDLQQWAVENHPSVDIDKETAKFKNWEYKTSCSDWTARWKLWIQRNAEYQKKMNGTSNRPTATEELLKLGKEFGVDRQSGESEAEYLDRIHEMNQRRMKDLNQ